MGLSSSTPFPVGRAFIQIARSYCVETRMELNKLLQNLRQDTFQTLPEATMVRLCSTQFLIRSDGSLAIAYCVMSMLTLYS